MKTPKELSLLIAANVRKRRKGQKLSMQDLSDKSGVSYGSIKRFESISATKEGTTAHIILLSTQAAAVQQALKGRSAVLHPITVQLAEQFLGLPPQLPEPDSSPFQTGKGRVLYAPSFGQAPKTGGQGGGRLDSG